MKKSDLDIKNTEYNKGHISHGIINCLTIYKQAWAFTIKHLHTYSLLLLLVIVVNMVNNGFDVEKLSTINEGARILVATLNFILSLASAWLSIGFINLSLKTISDQKCTFGDGLIDFHKTLKIFIAKIITGILVMIAYIPLLLVIFERGNDLTSLQGTFFLIFLITFFALVVATIVFEIRLTFVSTLILDKNISARESIKESREMTKGAVSKLFIIVILSKAILLPSIILIIIGLFWSLPIIAFIGLISLGFGIFRAVPFIVLSQTLAYRALRDQK